MRLLTAAVLVGFFSCGGVGMTRQVQGRVTGISSAELVVAETSGFGQSTTVIDSSGAFRLGVPVNQPVRLLVVTKASHGKYRVLQYIGPEWFTLRAGGLIDVGYVRPLGVTAPVNVWVSEPRHLCPSSTDNLGGPLAVVATSEAQANGDDDTCEPVEIEHTCSQKAQCDSDFDMLPASGPSSCGGSVTPPLFP